MKPSEPAFRRHWLVAGHAAVAGFETTNMTPEGYPDDDEIDVIASWPFDIGWDQLMSYVRQRWKYNGWNEAVKVNDDGEEVRRYTLATGGWSGNEQLVGALRANMVFWSMAWQSSERGGRHVFEL